MDTLIITLGSRELAFDRERVENVLNEQIPDRCFDRNGHPIARYTGEFIQTQMGKPGIWKELQWPIVKPALEFLKKHDIAIGRVIYVVTGQDEHVQELYRSKDTLHYAPILEQWLSKRGGLKGTPKQQTLVIKDGAIYVDVMLNHFDAQFREGMLKFLTTNDQNVYLLNQGGIDGINNGLLLAAIQHLGRRLVVLHVNEATGLCGKLKISHQLEDARVVQTAKALVTQFHYPAVVAMELPEKVRSIADYASHRLNFDFGKAREALGKMEMSLRDFRDRELVELNDIEKDGKSLVREVYHNAQIKFKQEAYVDFLLRIFRVIEGYLIERMRGIVGFEIVPSVWKKEILTFLDMEENKGLKDHLETVTVSGEHLEPTQMGITVYREILGFYDPEKVTALIKVEALSNMRNQSIGAHNFKPVSLEGIANQLQKKGLSIEGMFDVFDDLLDNGENPFERINRKILENL